MDDDVCRRDSLGGDGVGLSDRSSSIVEKNTREYLVVVGRELQRWDRQTKEEAIDLCTICV